MLLLRRYLWNDWTLGALVGLLAVLIGLWHPNAWHIPIWRQYTAFGVDWAPPVMFATGYGMVLPEDLDLPGLRAFLFEGKALRDTSGWPETVATSEFSLFHRRHMALMYLMGWTWRIFGVDWQNLRIPILAGFALCAAAVYGLSRLLNGRVLSMVCALAFAASPGVAASLALFRDFSKAPFILWAIFLMALAIRHAWRPRGLLLLAVATGACIGLGASFRQDVLICLPPALGFFCVARLAPGIRAWRWRAAGAAALLAGFAAGGLYYLRADRESGTEMWHHLCMGLSTGLQNEVGLGRASYEYMAVYYDPYPVRTAQRYAEETAGLLHNLGWFDAAMIEAERNYFLYVGRTFPGDLIARVYAAALWVLRGAEPVWNGVLAPDPGRDFDVKGNWHARFAALFERPGPWVAAFVLFGIACVRFRDAWLTLGLLLYFTGYVSLQYQYRHAFHLSFVPLLLLATAITFSLYALRRMAMPGAAARPPIGVLLRGGVKGAVFLLLAGAALWSPLALARHWQASQLEPLFARYRDAEIRPIETVRHAQEQEMILVQPQNRTESRFFARFSALSPSDYVVAEFRLTGSPLWLDVSYDTWENFNNFNQAMAIDPAAWPNSGRVRVFIPIHETTHTLHWTRFSGIALPRDRADELIALYRVENQRQLAPWLTVFLPEDDRDLRFCREIGRAGELPSDAAIRWAYAQEAAQGRDLMDQQEWEALLAWSEKMSARVPRNTAFIGLRAEALLGLGRREEALAAYLRAFAIDPEFAPFIERPLGIVRETGPGEELELRRRMYFLRPRSMEAVFGLAQAEGQAGRERAGLHLAGSFCWDALRRKPWSMVAAVGFDAVLAAAGDPVRRATIWKTLSVNVHPPKEVVLYMQRLALIAAGQGAQAVSPGEILADLAPYARSDFLRRLAAIMCGIDQTEHLEQILRDFGAVCVPPENCSLREVFDPLETSLRATRRGEAADALEAAVVAVLSAQS